MKTTIDNAGRLVIPKEIRRKAGLKLGLPLDVRWENGKIVITPDYLPVKLVRKGHFLVAVPITSVPPLESDLVEQVRAAHMQSR